MASICAGTCDGNLVQPLPPPSLHTPHRTRRISIALRDCKAKNPKASLREVASVFGVSHMTVKRAQKMRKFEAGKKANVASVKVRAKGKAQMVEQIRAIKVDNPSLSTREIAKIVDRSHMTVARALRGSDT